MIFKFYARTREDGVPLIVKHPEEVPFVGQLPSYVGRESLPGGKFPESKKPFACESGTRTGERLRIVCGRGELWPADAATAEACGVPFVPLKFNSGVWQPAKAATGEKKG